MSFKFCWCGWRKQLFFYIFVIEINVIILQVIKYQTKDKGIILKIMFLYCKISLELRNKDHEVLIQLYLIFLVMQSILGVN